MTRKQSLSTFRRITIVVTLTLQHTQDAQDKQCLGHGCWREVEAVSNGGRMQLGMPIPHLFTQEDPVVLCVPQIPVCFPSGCAGDGARGLLCVLFHWAIPHPRFLSLFTFLDLQNKSFWIFDLSLVEHTQVQNLLVWRPTVYVYLMCLRSSPDPNIRVFRMGSGTGSGMGCF